MSFDRHLVDALRDLGTPERAAQEKRYLRSALEHWGAPVPAVRRAVREALRDDDLDARRSLVREALALWSRPVHECRLAAVELLTARHALLEGDDVATLERMLREARTWALVDPLAANVAGPLVAREPDLGATLDRWSTDEDFWLRRASMLSLLVPLRRGAGDFERFGRYADAMLEEREVFIRKCIGWVLREVAKRRPALVAAWVRPRAKRMAGMTYREATRTLPAATRARLDAARG